MHRHNLPKFLPYFPGTRTDKVARPIPESLEAIDKHPSCQKMAGVIALGIHSVPLPSGARLGVVSQPGIEKSFWYEVRRIELLHNSDPIVETGFRTCCSVSPIIRRRFETSVGVRSLSCLATSESAFPLARRKPPNNSCV